VSCLNRDIVTFVNFTILMINKEHLNNLSNEVWKAAIKLRGKFKAKDYPSVILPMILIRRIECVLEDKREGFREDILSASPDLDAETLESRVKILERNTEFYNESNWTLAKILDESPTQVESNFRDYLNQFSENIGEIIDRFDFRSTVTKVSKAKRLSSILQFASDADFSPSALSNLEMGYVYEDLLQRFSQDDAKDTGEHFTPREIIRIMVDLMDIDFDPETSTQAISIYDPACGTGGMLSIAKEHLVDKATTETGVSNVETLVLLNGQELLGHNYAVCRADMILKGESHVNITCGNSLIPHIESIEDDGDQHVGQRFDYMICNPPFGVNWKEYKEDAERLSTSRYRWGMPAVGDGALLFLMTLIEKMKPVSDGGSRISILFNGSPLSNGDAMSGESEIRRNLLENDLLEAIVMLPDQMFYNTGIYTYIWVLNNNKPSHKKGKVLLVNARSKCEKEPKSFGNKRNRMTVDHRKWVNDKFGAWAEDESCKIFDTTDFAFHKIKLTYWQEDEHGEKMWIREPIETNLNNQKANTLHEKYGNFTFFMEIESTDVEDGVISVELPFDREKPFETMLAEKLRGEVECLLGKNLTECKKWVKAQEMKVEYLHRHYIDDTEYIPYDAQARDRKAHIEAFLDREIDYEVVQWEEVEQLGYEILPNKYFYEYVKPIASDDLLESFYGLEEKANELLTSIKEL